jgi:transcriptional regulator with XRE-family HTH domain
LTQKAVAEAAGLRKDRVSILERSARPRCSDVAAMARALDLGLAELLAGAVVSVRAGVWVEGGVLVPVRPKRLAVDGTELRIDDAGALRRTE